MVLTRSGVESVGDSQQLSAADVAAGRNGTRSPPLPATPLAAHGTDSDAAVEAPVSPALPASPATSALSQAPTPIVMTDQQLTQILQMLRTQTPPSAPPSVSTFSSGNFAKCEGK